MTSSKKRLFIMLGAVLLMGGLLVLLLLGGGDADAPLLSGSDAEEEIGNENDMLIYRGADEMERMVLTNHDGTFTMERDANGELTIRELAGMPQNTDFIELAWYCPINLGYSDTLMMPADSVNLADYGLDHPLAVIDAYFTDGTQAKISIGNAVVSGDDSYYFMLSGDNTIYTTQFDSALFLGFRYWLSDNIFESDYSEEIEISSIKLTLEDVATPIVLAPHTAADKSDPFYNYDYIMTSPEKCGADNYFMSQLIYELSWLTAYEAVEINPTAATLAEYGLDKPYAVAEVVRNGTARTLTLARYDYDTLYATVDGVPVIYMIDANSSEALASLSFRTIRSTDIHVRYFDAIESFTVTSADGGCAVRLERVPLQGGDGLFEYYAYCGDTPIALSDYKALLEIFNSAAASDYTAAASSEEPYFTVRISYFEEFGREDELITYTECGTRRYLCSINGSGTAVATSMWTEKFLDGVRRLAAGETVTP